LVSIKLVLIKLLCQNVAFFGCAAKVIIVAVFSQYLAAAVPFIGVIVFYLQKFYLQTSRQVRLLEIEAKAPLFTHFLESKAGTSTIRAFRWQAEYRMRNRRHTDTSQQPAYLQNCIQQCLTFILDLIVAILTTILVTVTVVWKDRFDAGSIGVSLVTIVAFSQTLARLITMWTMMESSVGAVSRVRRFIAETESEETPDRFYVPPEEWPQTGAIEIQSLVASHGYVARIRFISIFITVQM
jgi:ATP-binding cassette, subfamily C (CFTR/MRP), member 1